MAKLETLQDDFNDGVLDPRWSITGSLPYSETTQLNVTSNIDLGSFEIYESGIFYDFSNSQVTLDVSLGTPPDSVFGMRVTSGRDTITYYISSTLIYGVFTRTTVFSTSYDPINHRIIRLREADGVTYFEASLDGLTYTVLHSASTPYSVVNIRFSFLVFANTPSSGNIVEIKNLNHTYALPPNPCVKLRGKCKIRGKVQLR